MNKRIRKKKNGKTISLNPMKEKKQPSTKSLISVPISSRVCPVCGLHVIIDKDDNYFCCLCHKKYHTNELSPDEEPLTEEERQEILQRFIG